MNKARLITFLLCGLVCSGNALSTERMYGVASIGYADADLDGTSASSASYRFALGHQFHRQWYVELGYQDIVSDEADDFGVGIAAEAITLSALGKAANRNGELFYRIGIANIDVTGLVEADQQGACNVGEVVGTLESVGPLCGFDESLFGGVAGLGFDFYVGLNAMVRVEAEYMYGEDEYSNGAVYVGFRYNFN